MPRFLEFVNQLPGTFTIELSQKLTAKAPGNSIDDWQ
jgi:hypothetical protein